MNAQAKLSEMVANPNRFFIGGEWVNPSTSSTLDVITPSSEEVFGTVAEAQAEDIARAVTAARTAFDDGPWPRMSHAERAKYLNAIAAKLRERAPELAASWTAEMGVVHGYASMLIPPLAEIFEYHAGLAESFPFEERHQPKGGGVGILVREPVGVVAAIIPWNFPVMLICWKIAPALLSGCTVVLKASPEAPTASLIMAEIAQAVGLPKGVLNVVTADREVSELLVRDPRIDKVTFTGSSAAGKKIASICGERIARYTLELGGKSAAVIFDDYDVAKVAKDVIGGACMMTGQICSSLTRFVVPRKRHDQLVESLAASFAATKVGDPFDGKTNMGPLAMSRQRQRVENYIAAGKSEGAKLATGGGRPAHLNRGFFIEPTVFGNVSNDMTIAREEIFGPVVSVIPADDEQHAMKIANDTVYGLNAAVFTNDPDKAYRAARELRSGSVGQNGSRTDFTIAFGGFKQSGYGREGGTEGLRHFLETKTIVLDAEPAHLRSAKA